MHELSAARNLVELIQNEIPPADLSSVRSVRILIGDLAGIVPDSLEFCYTVVTEGTPLAASRLSFERVPFEIYCANCERSSCNTEGTVFCPHCSHPASSIMRGNELELSGIEVEDE
ncbi:MAG: hydrogenase maturation nickel metallochaperone HypA [Bacteroidota bacterium]